MILPTLMRQHHPLADPAAQLRLLNEAGQPPFEQTLARSGVEPLRAAGIQVLQVNVGKLCNQTCRHCHVDAGPERREVMSRETMELCLDALARADIPLLDITGGAPEMNPHFRWFVAAARRLGRHVIDRCNLTILLTPGHDDLAAFLAEQGVEIVASLPCYLAENTDAQRGDGVFDRSITALRRLNALGYGHPDSGLELTLVYNPVGAGLPPPQSRLEADYRRELADRYGIVFNRLYTITNMPISRFLEDLVRTAGTRNTWRSWWRRTTRRPWPASCAGRCYPSAGTAGCTIAISIRCSTSTWLRACRDTSAISTPPR